MNPLDPILDAYAAGHAALLVTGRSLYDLAPDADGRLRPLMTMLRRQCRQSYGMVLATYSLAGGLEWDRGVETDADRRRITEVLRSHHLADTPLDQNEVVRVIRGISSLGRSHTGDLAWSDGRPLRFCFLLEFGEHLTPGSLTNGTQSEAQLVSIELAHITAQSLALRASGNLIVFHAREGLVDDLVCAALHPVRLPQPGSQEKKAFLESARSVYPNAKLEDGLDPAAVIHLTTNTPNRGMEALLRASHRSGRPVTSAELLERRHRDVSEMSEGTLLPLDTTRVEGLRLHGINVATPQAVLDRFAAALRRGDTSAPANVMLVGPPGTGKTDLAILTARRAGVAAYQQLSPKGGIVGETERKARIQQETLLAWTPNISYVDEITESLPLTRPEFNGDSGASSAVTAALLTALSNESRRGRSLLIASTNCPWRMGAAMRNRFLMVPVLHPVAADFPGIIASTARRILPGAVIDPGAPRVSEAAHILFEKGANPRHIRSALSQALLMHGKLTPETVLVSAMDLRAVTDRVSAIYADLWAVQACSSESLLPWSSDPGHYPFPAHLDGAVDRETGKVNDAELARRIEEYRPHANL